MVQSVFVDTFDQQHVESLTNEGVKTRLSKLLLDTSLMEKVASLKNTLLRKKECLSHGLLSTSSIGVKDGDVKVRTSAHCVNFTDNEIISRNINQCFA